MEWCDIKRVKGKRRRGTRKTITQSCGGTAIQSPPNIEQGITKNRNCECAIRKIAKQFIVGQTMAIVCQSAVLKDTLTVRLMNYNLLHV